MNRPAFIFLVLLMIAAVALAFNPPAALINLLAATDVTAKYAKTSFSKMLESLPSGSAAQKTGNGWKITAPDDSAEFSWNTRTTDKTEPAALLRVRAQPFIDAGLDASRLPAGLLRDGMLTFSVEPGVDAVEQTRPTKPVPTENTPGTSFAALVDSCRERIGYHFQLGHFGFEFDGGNQVEWASDPETNDLDLVFALDPRLLLRAGVDKDKVRGWTFGEVTVHGDGGGEITAPKFLKPFNLQ